MPSYRSLLSSEFVMDFRIADTFTDSLAKLTGDEQKAAKTAAFDLQLNPAQPGLSFHKLDRARDPNFWSVRVSRDVRMIVHRTGRSLLLCYVDHHDDAYQWAERRKLETHPKTGAAQLVEVRETVREITVPVVAPTVTEASADTPTKPMPFAEVADGDLLKYGVPDEWLDDVRAADEDSLLDLAGHLPSEAAEALLEWAVSGKPPRVAPVPVSDPFDHPDARRRFRVMHDVEELERALDYAWEKWAVFLHPAQRQVVEQDYNGPCRVTGTAGTGKTVVALHRAVHLARAHPEARILLTTFSETLAGFLRTKLTRLIRREPRLRERLEVDAIDAVGERLYRARFGPPDIAARNQIWESLAKAAVAAETNEFSPQFLMSEWEDVVDAWQLDSWEAYRDVRRLGRKKRLPLERRERLWSVFERVRADLRQRGMVTRNDMFSALAAELGERRNPPFDFAIVDEAQDISVAQLRFLSRLAGQRPNGLFLAGDPGQRIFQASFSWKALGVDVRGRSHTLRLNYRMSHQIRTRADRLLGAEIADVDGNVDDRRGAISAFNGEPPTIRLFESESDEIDAVGRWLRERLEAGVVPREIGIFVRSDNELDRAREAAARAGAPHRVLDDRAVEGGDTVSVCTMHLAKGLEFRVVAVMACDDEVIPLQERIENVADDADLEEVYNTERHLLYVACTRARDHLLITGVGPASEFLDDIATQADFRS